jgi:hypothetical protein
MMTDQQSQLLNAVKLHIIGRILNATTMEELDYIIGRSPNDYNKDNLKRPDAPDMLIKLNRIDTHTARVLQYAMHYYRVSNLYDLLHKLSLDDFLKVRGCGNKMYKCVAMIYELYQIPKEHRQPI